MCRNYFEIYAYYLNIEQSLSYYNIHFYLDISLLLTLRSKQLWRVKKVYRINIKKWIIFV